MINIRVHIVLAAPKMMSSKTKTKWDFYIVTIYQNMDSKYYLYQIFNQVKNIARDYKIIIIN